MSDFDAKALLDERDPVVVVNERRLTEARSDLRTAVDDYLAAEKRSNELLAKLGELRKQYEGKNVRPQDLPRTVRDASRAFEEAYNDAKMLARRAQGARQTLDHVKAKAEAQPNEPTPAEIAAALRRGLPLS